MKSKIQFLMFMTMVMFTSIGAFASTIVEKFNCSGQIAITTDTSENVDLNLVITDILDSDSGRLSRLITSTNFGLSYEGLSKPGDYGQQLLVLENSTDAKAPALFKGSFKRTWGLGASMKLFGKLTIKKIVFHSKGDVSIDYVTYDLDGSKLNCSN